MYSCAYHCIAVDTCRSYGNLRLIFLLSTVFDSWKWSKVVQKNSTVHRISRLCSRCLETWKILSLMFVTLREAKSILFSFAFGSLLKASSFQAINTNKISLLHTIKRSTYLASFPSAASTEKNKIKIYHQYNKTPKTKGRAKSFLAWISNLLFLSNKSKLVMRVNVSVQSTCIIRTFRLSTSTRSSTTFEFQSCYVPRAPLLLAANQLNRRLLVWDNPMHMC